MKKQLFVLALILTPAIQAAEVSLQDLIAMSRAQVQAERQAVITASLGLTEAEGKVFWPMYRDYRAEMNKPLDRTWNLLTTYAEHWDSLTDIDATTALDEWLSVEKQQTEIKQKWARNMMKQLKPVTVARFFQIDNKLDAVLRLEAAAEIPVISGKK
jgi:hypothetical protein